MSTTFTSEVLAILATLVWRNCRQKLQMARLVGVIFDEVEDCSIQAKLLVYYRFASKLGKVVVQYA